MKRSPLITALLITLILTPTFVLAIDDSVIKTAQVHLVHFDYIWNLLAGALVFFLKSREII
ncbi:MAG: hypothetical protein D3916_05195 [Candidatus Electrothrix sp. MAN1_4]|nr:hypothetical protein [Candidatus Electrothrix sp. MAN1_4]